MPAEALYTMESGYHAANLEVCPKAFDLIAAERCRKIQTHLKAGESLLEFGVGTGLNLARLQLTRKVGCDTATHLAGQLRSLGIEFTDLGAIGDHSFDSVLSHHSLEHVPSPLSTLRELRRVLRPGGKLLLYVPFEKERRYRRYDPREPNHHLHSWNVQTLANLVTVSGFAVESCECGPAGYERFAARIAVRLGFGDASYRCLLGVLRLLHTPEEIRLVARRNATA